MPEKYVVKKEDGTVDHEATALKVAQAHAALEKRMGWHLLIAARPV